MNEYEWLFALTLQKKLKTKIIGKIYVEVNEKDQLYVRVSRVRENLTYEYFVQNFNEKIQNGYSTDNVKTDVLEDYKEFIWNKILSRYFYTDRKEPATHDDDQERDSGSV